MSKQTIGSVMVVGGGIAGIQSALDMADAGFLVHLVEKTPAIGGVMSALDKTFPTNDCAMCILSPKLVEVGRHRNINLLTLSGVQSIEGEAGNFQVTVQERPRYVDLGKCIACGKCAEKCPRKVANEFNQNLSQRKAVYVPYPQAVPLKYVIDADNCIYFQKGKCRACEKFCPADAIDFEQDEKIHTIDVGAVIMSPGFESFDPGTMDMYGYGVLPNVVTAREFERVLSASGPFEGHLVRPSDHSEPKKIAWLQCVGSRNIREDAHGYCSGVCCMYAIKEAVIAKEHAGGDLDTAIFFMDMRTHGKGFEQTYNRARDEQGVRFIRARFHSIEPVHGSDDLQLTYFTDDGELKHEIFSLVVLSTGLEIPQDLQTLTQQLAVEIDSDGFASTRCFAPVATSRPGIFAAGVFSGPKDIPQSVMEASAASSMATALLSSSRNTLTREKILPDEQDVSGLEPRIGVFVCHCGTNIGGVVNVPEVVKYAKGLPGVAFSSDTLFTCSQDSQENIRKAISEHRLNRVVVAACTPRTHEPLFQQTIQEAGLNPYLFEFANIRDQNAWVHQGDPESATQKAKDLVRMAAAKAALLEPITPIQIEVNRDALVIGGGIAGMQAALNLAEQGFQTYLVERHSELGGQALIHVRNTWQGDDVPAFLSELRDRVMGHKNIQVFLEAEIKAIEGYVGNFTTAIHSAKGEQELRHGAVVLATGGKPYEPDEYLYGQSDRVMKWHELEALFESQPEKLNKTQAVAFIQCVGSREPGRPYCSKICCTASVKSAIALKEKKPDLRVYILYRDMRTFGQREQLYQKAREMGITFIRYEANEKPIVEAGKDQGLLISIKDPILQMPLQIAVDYLNLATAIVPTEGQTQLAQMLKVPLNDEGFYMEAHIKLRPVDFATDGVYVAGLAHYPKPIEEAISQAQAAAGRAAGLLSQPFISIEPIVSMVDEEKCIGCGLCEASCAFGAIRLKQVTGKGYRAENYSALCKGCGVCAAGCPQHAIDMKHFRDSQILAVIRAGGTGI